MPCSSILWLHSNYVFKRIPSVSEPHYEFFRSAVEPFLIGHILCLCQSNPQTVLRGNHICINQISELSESYTHAVLVICTRIHMNELFNFSSSFINIMFFIEPLNRNIRVLLFRFPISLSLTISPLRGQMGSGNFLFFIVLLS